MTAELQFREFLAQFDPAIAALARAALAKLRKRLPGSFELVYDNYNALVVGFGPSERASEAIFSLAIFPRFVSLFFLQGAGLPDPDRILRGSGNVVRSIRLETPEVLDRPEVKAIMTTALARAIVPLDSKGRRRFLITSVSPTRRARRPGGKPAAPARGRSVAAAAPSVAGHFENKAPVVRKIYDRILAAARKLGPTREEAKPSAIHLVRASAFAGIATQRQALILTLKATADIRSPRVKRRDRTSANRWHVEFKLEAPAQVDRELMRWLREAYALAG